MAKVTIMRSAKPASKTRHVLIKKTTIETQTLVLTIHIVVIEDRYHRPILQHQTHQKSSLQNLIRNLSLIQYLTL